MNDNDHFSRCSERDLSSIRIIVMLSHENGTSNGWVQRTLATLSSSFPREIASGFLHLIVPPVAWFPPDLHSVPPTFGFSPLAYPPSPHPYTIFFCRMHWRTKQCTDFMYLINYARTHGEFYLQLEDDVLPSYHYS